MAKAFRNKNLERVLDAIPVGVNIVDRNGRVTFSNTAASGLFKLERRDIIGQSFHDLGWKVTTMDGKHITPKEHPFAKLLQTGEPVYGFEHIHEYPDGFRVIMSASAMPLYDEEGALTGAVISHSDITAQKRAEEVLKESEKRFRATFEQAAVGIAHVALDGRFIRLNQRYADIIGYTKEELTGLTFQEITYPEDLEVDLEQVRQLLEGRINTYTMEKRYIRKDGPLVWVNLTVSLVRDEEGRPQYFIAVIEDISSRKSTEEALRESERRFREMLEEVDIVSLTLDTEGKVTFANEFLLSLTGRRREEVIGKDWFNTFIPPEQRNEVKNVFLEAVLKGVVAAHYENDILTEWGERRTIAFTNVVLRDIKGNVVGIASLGEDITEARRAAEEIRESRKQVLDILESITDGFFALDTLDRLTYINSRAQQFLRVRREKVLFRDIREVLAEVEAPMFYQELYKAVEEKTPRTFEQFFMPLSRWFEIHIYPYKSGLSVYFTDITDRKSAEKALKDSENRYRLLVDLSPDGIVVHSGGVVLYVNAATLKMFRISDPNEVIGKPLLGFVHPDYRGAVVERVKRMQKGEVVGALEEKFLRTDGSAIDVEVAAAPIIYEGKPAVQVVFRDITERKRIEEERRVAKELSDALNSINAAISSTLDFDEIMRRVIVESIKAIGSESAIIVLREGNHWVVRYIYGLPQELVGTRLTNEDVVSAVLAAKTKRPVVINDAYHDERINRKTAERFNIHSFLNVPLIVRGMVIGILYFNYHSAPIAFTESQIDFADKLGASISLALENARLYEAR